MKLGSSRQLSSLAISAHDQMTFGEVNRIEAVNDVQPTRVHKHGA
jgi:hypothetical protein